MCTLLMIFVHAISRAFCSVFYAVFRERRTNKNHKVMNKSNKNDASTLLMFPHFAEEIYFNISSSYCCYSFFFHRRFESKWNGKILQIIWPIMSIKWNSSAFCIATIFAIHKYQSNRREIGKKKVCVITYHRRWVTTLNLVVPAANLLSVAATNWHQKSAYSFHCFDSSTGIIWEKTRTTNYYSIDNAKWLKKFVFVGRFKIIVNY